jgi:two-component system, LytTR family, response regulator
MSLTCMIVDDEPALVELLELYVQQTPNLQLLCSTTSPLQGIEAVNTLRPQLVFLDVEMAELSGIEFIEAVQGKTRIVLCTGYAQYALDGYEHDVIDFLLKPVGFERFTRAVEKALQLITAEIKPEMLAEKDHLFTISGAKSRHIKINFEDIDYIRSLKNYTAFYCGGKKIISRINISEVEAQLPATQFIRVHKSYIIPVKKVVSFNSNFLCLKNTLREIPIGGTYKPSVFKILKAEKNTDKD